MAERRDPRGTPRPSYNHAHPLNLPTPGGLRWAPFLLSCGDLPHFIEVSRHRIGEWFRHVLARSRRRDSQLPDRFHRALEHRR